MRPERLIAEALYSYPDDLVIATKGGIKLDRFISASAVFPTDYGYVPETLAPDGDPLDVLGASQS